MSAGLTNVARARDRMRLVEAPRSERLEYFPALDGLRALAIASVVLAHLLTAAGSLLDAQHPADRVVIAAALRGWMGVDLFFVLSGFLITRILLDSRAASGYYRQFYGRRVLRIFPLYYVTLVATLLVLPRVSAAFTTDPSSHWVYWLYVSNVPAGLWTWWREPLFLAHFWSLAIEEQFYVIWPAVVRRPSVRAVAAFCGVLIAAAIAIRIATVVSGANPYLNYKMLFTRMDALAIGGLLACLERMPGTWATLRRHARTVVLAGGLLILAFGRGLLTHPLTQAFGFTANAIASAGLIVLALRPSAGWTLNRVLESVPLIYIGQRSYAIYVLHPLVVFAIGGFTPERFGNGLTGFATFALLAVGGTVALAELSWRLLEHPMLALKRFVPRAAAPPQSNAV
jgi:peptidoglycan/LPS O-acetylase OafA/YrhL